MFILSKLLKYIPRLTTKQVIIGAVYFALLAGSAGLGLANRQNGSAAVIRDCSLNSINYLSYAGGCGSADAPEYIRDLNHNVPGDLQGVSNHFGLSTSEYNRFLANAKPGMVHKNTGKVIVNGQTVVEDSWSIGRNSKSYSTPYPIGNKTYHKSMSTRVLGQDLPVMVLFDANGVAEFIVINACGNPVGGRKIRPSVNCNSLVSHQDQSNPNKYTFTANASFGPNTTLNRVVYHFSDGRPDITTHSLGEATPAQILTQDTTVSVTVYANVPGGNVIQSQPVAACQKLIVYEAPIYACLAIIPTMPDPKKDHLFRFTIYTLAGPNVTVDSADFTLDGSSTTTGVTQKDADGDIYKDYTFSDENSHTVKAVVYFNTLEGLKSDTSTFCQASAKAEEKPHCPVPGREHLPPNDERCGYCKPGIPKGDIRCVPPKCVPKPYEDKNCQPLPNTGPGDVLGLFVGTSAAGAIGHRLFARRRAARLDQ